MIGWQIKSHITEFAVCPIWQHRTHARVIDEAIVIDSAIDASLLAGVREARKALLSRLQSQQLAMGGSRLLTEQLVRFAVDQQEYATAISAASRCTPDGWQCAALRVYASWASGDHLAAQSFLAGALRGRDCADLLLGHVLITDELRRWERASCTERQRLEDQAWWLADPLWSDALDERVLLQIVRETQLRLRSAFDRDERFVWRPRQGSDARARMLLRYGWPNYMQWAGPLTDNDHTRYLVHPNQRRSPDNEPYVSYEYRSPRVALVPAIRDVQALYDAPRQAFVPRVLQAPDPWTHEHAALPFALRALEPVQAAALRRADSVLLAVAVELTPESLARRGGLPVPVRVMLGRDPADTRLAAAATGTVGAAQVFRTLEASRPIMLSVEVPADAAPAAPAARDRFGLRLPPPLRAMRPGELAISVPVLLKPMAVVDEVPTDPDAALARMAGTTTVPPVGKLGIYWETYGIALSDTVDVAVWIARTDEPGLLRRVGRAMRIVPGAESPSGVSWREPLSARNATLVGNDPVPIIGRGLALDLTNLAPGEYWVEVAVARPGQEPVRGRSPFRIRAPQ